jgi:hypothetical protein
VERREVLFDVSHPRTPGEAAQRGSPSEAPIWRNSPTTGSQPSGTRLVGNTPSTAYARLKKQDTLLAELASPFMNIRRTKSPTSRFRGLFVGVPASAATRWVAHPRNFSRVSTPRVPAPFNKCCGRTRNRVSHLSELITPGCLVTGLVEPQSLSPYGKLTGALTVPESGRTWYSSSDAQERLEYMTSSFPLRESAAFFLFVYKSVTP